MIQEPKWLERDELITQILVPAFNEGHLGEDRDPVHFAKRIDRLATEEVRTWAEEVLRAHPWPPGVYIPSFAEWVESRDYLGTVKLTERQRYWFEASIGPHAEDWFVKKRHHTLLVLMAGKGSGKDMFASFVNSYVPYCVQLMRNPWWHFRIPVGEPMDIVNVAQNQRQARRVFFTKLRRNLTRKCFIGMLSKKQILADEVFFKKNMPGESEVLDTLRLHSLNSQNEAAEGLNTLAFTLDEFDAFRTKEGSQSADLMLNTLQTSSRFRDLQLGIVISYPRALNGPLMRVLGQCGNMGGENPEWWGDRAPSWEVLPWRTYMEAIYEGRKLWTNPTGLKLIKEGKAEEALKLGVLNDLPDQEMARLYRTNREKFDEVYGCDPPASVDAYIQMPQKIDEAIEFGEAACIEPIAKVTPYIEEAEETATGRVRKFVARRLDEINMRPGVTYFIGADAGETQDSFTLCVAHMISPKEKGAICPTCWGDRVKRMGKHYLPEPIPAKEEEPDFDPSLYPCDYCKRLPIPPQAQNPTLTPPFWGFARPSGVPMEREVIMGHNANGEPIYQTEDVPVRDPNTGITRYEQRVVTERYYLPLVVEDLLIEWRPDKVRGLTVSFENVKDVILQLTRHGIIGAARFDKWQATMMVQQLQRTGMDATTEWFGNPAQLQWYANMKHLLYTNQLLLQPDQPDNPAYAKARRELREVQLINNNRIDHPEESAGGERGSKDLTDAQALAFNLCVNHEIARGMIDTGRLDPNTAAMHAQSEAAARVELAPNSVVGAAIRDLGLLGRRR